MTLRTAAAAVLARWDSPQWEWTKHGPTADLMADLRAALAQPAAPDAPLVAGQVIAGAVYDLMGYLTTLDKSISLGSSELATPASDALSDWAMTRGLSLDEPDIANWHTHIAAPDVQPVARVLVWKGPRHINTPPVRERLTLDAVIAMAVGAGLGHALSPIGLDTGKVFRTDAAYRTSELEEFARAIGRALIGGEG